MSRMSRVLTAALVAMSAGCGGSSSPTVPTLGSWEKLPVAWGARAPTVVCTPTAMVLWGGFNPGEAGECGSAPCNYATSLDYASGVLEQLPRDGAPEGRSWGAGAWLGSRAVVWGGQFSQHFGGLYDPATRAWDLLDWTVEGTAPEVDRGRRRLPSLAAVDGWLLMFGGQVTSPQGFVIVAAGRRYSLAERRWAPTSQEGQPSPRVYAAATSLGSRWFVWGGFTFGAVGTTGDAYSGDGGIYDPASDSWEPLAPTDVLPARAAAQAVWTGKEVIVWGGRSAEALGDGAAYNPSTRTWRKLSGVGAPTATAWHRMTWTGRYVVVVGNESSRPDIRIGGLYDPEADRWFGLPDGPPARHSPSLCWTGQDLLMFGGEFGEDDYQTDFWRWRP